MHREAIVQHHDAYVHRSPKPLSFPQADKAIIALVLHGFRIRTDRLSLRTENIVLVSEEHRLEDVPEKLIPSVSHREEYYRVAQSQLVLDDTTIQLKFNDEVAFESSTHSSVFFAKRCQPPEATVGSEWDADAGDIWSIGCIILEMLTHSVAVTAMDDREHLAMMEKLCGTTIDREEIPWVDEVLKEGCVGKHGDFSWWVPTVRLLSIMFHAPTNRSGKKVLSRRQARISWAVHLTRAAEVRQQHKEY